MSKEDRYGLYNYLSGNLILVSLIFIILGIGTVYIEKPVSLNTGEKSPREDELISVTDWNHRHGRNLIILGCMLFITSMFFMWYSIEKLMHCIAVWLVFIIVLFAEIAWVEFEHNMMKKKMIKNDKNSHSLQIEIC